MSLKVHLAKRVQGAETQIHVTPEQRYQMIAEAAYYLAERRNFQLGDPVQDWLQAEAEIDRRLAGNRLGLLSLSDSK